MKTLLAMLILLCGALIMAQVKPTQPVGTPSAGRYQLILNPNVRADQYLLDTATGKIWSAVTITDVVDTPKIWKYQERIDSDREYTDWAVRQTFLPSPTPAVIK